MLNREEIAFDAAGEDILVAVLSDRTRLEAIVICDSGRILLSDLARQTTSELGHLRFEPWKLNLQVHTSGSFVGITQKNGTLGVILNLTDPAFEKRLERGDYCANVSEFPIAFFSKNGRTYLIHGTDWNRLDITCLDSDELLTERVVAYDEATDTETNYFDYFHSSLLVSPDAKYFVSNGWHWHPYGRITLYPIDKFLVEFEDSHLDIDLVAKDEPEEATYQQGWDLPTCWLDDQTLAIGYNRGIGYYGKRNFPSEVLLVGVPDAAVMKRVPFDGFRVGVEGDVEGSLHVDHDRQLLLGLNKNSGLLIGDLDGNTKARHPELSSHHYSERHGLYYKFHKRDNRIELIRVDL